MADPTPTPTSTPVLSLSTGSILTGLAYFAQAFAVVVLNKDYSTAYQDVLKGVAAFGGLSLVKKMAADMDTMHAKGALFPHVKE